MTAASASSDRTSASAGHAGPAAPAASRVLAQARFEAETLLRNGEQLLVSLILPAMVLFVVHLGFTPSLGDGRRIDVGTPGVLALCIISASFTAQAIATGFERRYNVLRYLGTTPLGRGGLLAAKALATLAVQVVQFVVLGALALALGWRPEWSGLVPAVLFLLLGTWAFVSLGLLLGGTLRAEGVLALANLVWVLLLGLGGVIVPRTVFPDAVQPVLAFLPSAALADGLRAAFLHGAMEWAAALVLLVWGALAAAAAARLFRWSD